MHLLREESKTRPFLPHSIRDTFIMVQKLSEGRKETQRVESQAVEDVCLIARNAIDRIGELERLTSPFDEYEARERLRKTKERLNVHQNLAAALMEPKPWVGLTDAEITEIRLKTFDAVATNYEVYRAIEALLKGKNT